MKKLLAKVGTYQKDGKEKGEYARVGVLLTNDKGDYLLLDPTLSIAGVLAKQNVLALKEGKPARDMVMVSVFTEDNRDQAFQPQGMQQTQQAPPPQQAMQATPRQQFTPQDDFDDDIPF